MIAPKRKPADRKTRSRSTAPSSRGPRFGPVEIFYAQAIAVEGDACARYRELAREMAASGNVRTAELFQRLARFESGHAIELQERAAGMKLPTPAQLRRLSNEALPVEVGNYQFLYRRVPPQHALLMALAAERRAKEFFECIRASASEPAIRKVAAEFAREEGEHMVWIEEALAAEPPDRDPFDESTGVLSWPCLGQPLESGNGARRPRTNGRKGAK